MNQQIATLQALIMQGENGLKSRIEAIANLLDVARSITPTGVTFARKDTSAYYVRNTSKSKRQKLNDNAVALLNRIRNGELKPEELTDENKIALAHYSGCGGGLIGSDGKKGSAYEYYTPKAVAEGVWDAVKDLGFNGGRVLDPCAGVGIFGATSPLNSTIDACELNEDSGQINSVLNDGPGYRTHIGPFEEFASAIPDNSYDAVVSNVPFGGVEDRGANRFKDSQYQDHPLESYFILKALRKLRPGGIAALIAPVRCVGTGNDEASRMHDMRVEASLMAEFIGAYRLPSGTFSDAQTDTVTDVIFFRKYSRPVLQKIEELRSQNPSVLVESNVMWETFINGKYFTTAEGKHYIFGQEGTKRGQFGDVYAVIADSEGGKVQPNDVKELMRLKRLPKSRINWDLLNETETMPISYEDGDVIVQGGATLVMQDGQWVVQEGNHNTDMANALTTISSPYRAFENKVKYDHAKEINDYYSARCSNLDLPVWFRKAMAELGEKTEKDAAKYWGLGVLALSCDEVRADRREEASFDFVEGYAELSKAMAKAKATEAAGRKMGGSVGDSIRRMAQLYNRNTGYSDFWRGEIFADVQRTEEQDAFMQTEEGKLANLHYTAKSTWLKVSDVKGVKGENFDPYADDDWAMNANGEICEASDYYSGNYAEFIERIDEEIRSAKTQQIKDKLLRQKIIADGKVIKPNVKDLTFDLRSPYVTLEDKLEFLRSYGYMPYARIEENDGNRYIVGHPDASKLRDGPEKIKAKDQNSFAHYLSHGTIRVRGQKYDAKAKSTEEAIKINDQAVERVRTLVETANVQFNAWVKANKTISNRIEAQSGKPENCFFEYEEDSRPIDIPGIRKDDGKGNPLRLHDYQTAFVRKMGRGFEGINAFGVGLGKTLTSLAAVQYVQSIGAKKKTLFVVPKAVFSNWQKEANWVYTNPDDCLFVGMVKDKNGKDTFDSKAVLEHFDAIKNGKYSKIFMTMPVFEKLRMKEETIDDYLVYLGITDASLSGSVNKAQDESAKGKRQKIGSKLFDKKDLSAPFIEDLGIDSLVIDEAHFYKNATEANSFGRDIVSLSLSQASKRGADALAKAWYFRRQSPKQDGVLLLTATPITNSPLEMFSMLSLAVGSDKVNRLCAGTNGPDDFLSMVCDTRNENVVKLDASKENAEVFTGLKNVELLRSALKAVSTFKDAEALGAAKVEREEKASKVKLPSATLAEINRYRLAYVYAKADEHQRMQMPNEHRAFEDVKSKFGEEGSIIASPFNLLSKMQNEIADPDLNERASFYSFGESDEAKAEKLIAEWNKLDKKETESKLPRFVDEKDVISAPKNKDADAIAAWTGQDDDNRSEKDQWKYYVRAEVIDGNRIRLNAQSYALQNDFEKLAEKLGVELNAKPSAKQLALIENIRNEMANPRGLISRDPRVTSPIVKQIVFCDNTGIHSKLRMLIAKNCGISSSKIAIVTGKVNNDVDEILDVQNGFNAQGDENKYQLIIANEKAEVGINLQKGTQAIHHLTIGWTPDSIEQRNGRGARQGNATETVSIYFYDAENTFDEVKRNMVNKKSNWINSVVSADGGNKVDVARKFTNDDYEALASLTTDDPNAVQEYVKRREQIELEARKKEVENTQRICLETIKANRDWLNDNETPTNTMNAFVESLVNAQQKLILDRTAYEKAVKEERSEAYQNKLKDIVSQSQSVYDDLEKTFKASFKYQDSKAGDVWATIAEIKHRPNIYGLRDEGVFAKEQSLLHVMWKAKRESAESMIESSISAFVEKSNEPGGENPGTARAMAAKELETTGSGLKVWPNCFVRVKNGGLGLIGKGCVFCVDDRNGNPRWGEYSLNYVGDEVIYPDTPEYEDALVEAGKIENKMRTDRNDFNKEYSFAHNLPIVEDYVGEVVITTVSWKDVRLPSPHFPFIVRPEWLEGSELLNSIYEQQKEYVKSFSGRRSLRDYDDCYVELNRTEGVEFEQVRSDLSFIVQRVFTAIVSWAEANGKRVSLHDLPEKTSVSLGVSRALKMVKWYLENYFLCQEDNMKLMIDAAKQVKTTPKTAAEDYKTAMFEVVKEKVSVFDWSTFNRDDLKDELIGQYVEDAIDLMVSTLKTQIRQERLQKLEAKANSKQANVADAETDEDVLAKAKNDVNELGLDELVVVTNIVPDSQKTKVWHQAFGFKNYGARYAPRGCKKHPEYGPHTWTFKKSEWLRLIAEHPEVKVDLFARPAK